VRPLLAKYEKKLVVVHDSDDSYYLDTAFIMPNKKPMFFGAVRIGKAYVSFHLMGVYVYPDLLSDMSPELKKRMQGKSCFNFKQADKKLIAELRKLTKACRDRYRDAGMLG